MRLILDTDIGTDVDDALALAFALRHPEIDLKAVTTVSGDTVRRAHIAKKLLLLAGRPDVEVAAGGGPGAFMGHEGAGLPEPDEPLEISRRDAVTLLIEETARVADGGRSYAVATIGPQSNLASALERDASLPARVAKLAVMGGVFAPLETASGALSPSADHNLAADVTAAVAALNAGFSILYVPCDVTFTTVLTRSHLERLRRGDALCSALAALLDVWAPVLRKVTAGRIPSDVVAALHDPLTLWCMVDQRFHDVSETHVTVTEHGGTARTFADPVCGARARVVTPVDAAAFAEAFVDCLLAA